ncbi:hypothetical protein AAE478_002844 [Parahypoxylon ruwenzoriense]
MRPRLETLVGELRAEVQCLVRITENLGRSRDLSHVRQNHKHADSPNGVSSIGRAWRIPGWLNRFGTTGSKRHLREMAGGLSADKTYRRPAWIKNLRVRLERTTVNDAMGAETDTAALIRYQALKTRERLQGTGNAEASMAMWMAFRDDLAGKPGPPSTGICLLKLKADTRVLLAERQLQQGSGGGNVNGPAARHHEDMEKGAGKG